MRLCLSVANSLIYPAGGHLWVFLNWALGFRSVGCDVTWLDVVLPRMPVTELQQRAAHLRDVLAPFGISALAVDYKSDEHNAKALRDAGLDSVHDFAPFDLLFDLRYDLPHRLLTSARRSALLDIDPGHLQYALAGGGYPPPRHDVLFTIGEHVNASKHAIATQRRWVYTPPCVFLPEWPVCPSPPNAPWTTISHWWGNSWMPDETGVFVLDDKRAGFEHFMDLPSLVTGPFELALDLWNDLREKARIEQHGFRVVDAHDVAASPAGYRGFIQRSAGEFSAAKPSYVRDQTAWISDRTICYLASGKPCVVEHTGPSTVLPSGKGLHRVRNSVEAAKTLRRIYERYDDEAKEARSIAETVFDAAAICRRILTVAV
jgi:hypothetical protein